MGYYTNFSGDCMVEPKLEPHHLEYLQAFCRTRRMRRDPIVTLTLDDPLRTAVGLPLGREGEYFVGGTGDFGQGNDPGIVDFNYPPTGQPSLWCSWEIDKDSLSGPEDSKFYHYTEWLAYLIGHFFEPWGYKLNGDINWEGEDRNDAGCLSVVDNEITVYEAIVTFEPNDVETTNAEIYQASASVARKSNMIGAPNTTPV